MQNSGIFRYCKLFLYEKRLFGKLALAFEDEILNKSETSLVDKKVTCEKK